MRGALRPAWHVSNTLGVDGLAVHGADDSGGELVRCIRGMASLSGVAAVRDPGQPLEHVFDGCWHGQAGGSNAPQDQRPSLTTGMPAFAMLSTRSPGR